MPLSSKYSVGIGITTWKSYETLESTLETYRASGIVPLFDRALIWFQDMRDGDEELARKYGFEARGSGNRGLAMAMHNLTTALDTDYVILTENDCGIVEEKEEVERQLRAALELMEHGRVDLMRLRHRFHFGESFRIQKYLDFFPVRDLHPEFVEHDKLREHSDLLRTCRGLIRPGKKHWLSGRSVYFEREPEKLFPDVIEKDESGIYIVDSSAINFTTQSILLSREFFYRLIYQVYSHPSSRTSNGWISPERHINTSFWKQGGFKVGIGRGFFTHERLDGSWREGHRAYEETAVCG